MIFYTTHCPLCQTLEMKLKQAGVSYTVIDSEEEIIEAGITSVPALSVQGKLLYFSDAMNWLKNLMANQIDQEGETKDEDQHKT